MSTALPRIQVTVDRELSEALTEFGGPSRSHTVRELALRGARALREERDRRREALEFLRALDESEDEGYDFSVSEQLHAARR